MGRLVQFIAVRCHLVYQSEETVGYMYVGFYNMSTLDIRSVGVRPTPVVCVSRVNPQRGR